MISVLPLLGIESFSKNENFISLFPTLHLPLEQPEQLLYYWYNTILAIDIIIPIKFTISCIIAIFIIKNGVVIKHIILTVWHAIRG